VTGGLGNNHDLAHAAAAAAPYGDIARLLRLLGMIGTPAPVTETVESTLMVLADALQAELVCVASVVGDRIKPSAAYGLATDDPLFRSGWPLGPAGREALDQGTPVARAMVVPLERPPNLRGVSAASGAWIPLTAGADPADELLVLFRLGGRGFHPAELQVLSSAAYRMSSAVEALERANAIGRLAEGGPGLARHVDLTSLLDEAVEGPARPGSRACLRARTWRAVHRLPTAV
jgi:hypothetical protein